MDGYWFLKISSREFITHSLATDPFTVLEESLSEIVSSTSTDSLVFVRAAKCSSHLFQTHEFPPYPTKQFLHQLGDLQFNSTLTPLYLEITSDPTGQRPTPARLDSSLAPPKGSFASPG